jgi:hypothetical protein
VIKIREHIGWRDLNQDQVIVVDCQTTHIFLLSHVSSLIWRNLETASLENILEKILDEYDISESIAKNDLDDFITKIREKQLIL